MQPKHPEEQARVSSTLSKVLYLIHDGMCVTAYAYARDQKVQFTKKTLKLWLTTEKGPKRTYAWLVIGKPDWYASQP
jgi:hypothetical protein